MAPPPHHHHRNDEGPELDTFSILLRVVILLILFSYCIPMIVETFNYFTQLLPPFPSIPLPSIPLPSIPDWLRLDLSDTATNNHLVTAMLFAIALFVFCVERRTSRKCGRRGCRALNNADRILDFKVQDEDMLWDKVREVTMVNDLPDCRADDLEDGEYKSHMARLKEMAPNNGRAVLIFRLRCGCPFKKLSIRGPRTCNRRRK